MIKKIVSSVMSGALLIGGVTTAVLSTSASVTPSSEIKFTESDFGVAPTSLPPPEDFTVCDCIKELDPRVIKIMIDPGHYSFYNQSPVYPAYWESVMTWKLSNYLKTELEALGVHADLTKKDIDDDPDLNDRGFLSKGYDLFISVHSNASDLYYMDAPQAYVYQELAWTDIDDISKDVGSLLTDKVTQVMKTNQKGTVERRKGTADHDKNGMMDDEWYGVLFASRYIGTPGLLMEHSFHTNYRSTVWLYNDDNLKLLAKEEAAVIYDYFSEKKARDYPPTEPPATFPPLVIPDVPSLGDVNHDGMIDASDASAVLTEYALVSTGSKGLLSGDKLKAADVNSDDQIDAADASAILGYYSYLSVGGKERDMGKWIEEFTPEDPV